MITNIIIILLNITSIILLSISLNRTNKSKEKFSKNYDPKCIATCRTQSTNADDQCLNYCQIPNKDNCCWRDCYMKKDNFNDYLKCGQRCETK